MMGLMMMAAALVAAFLAHHAGEPKQPLLIDKLEAKGPPPVRYSGVLNGNDAASLAEILPPERFSGEGAAIVLFAEPASMQKLCGGALACAWVDKNGMPFIAIPNPCRFTLNPYAVVLCHEKGHTLGWPGEHGA